MTQSDNEDEDTRSRIGNQQPPIHDADGHAEITRHSDNEYEDTGSQMDEQQPPIDDVVENEWTETNDEQPREDPPDDDSRLVKPTPGSFISAARTEPKEPDTINVQYAAVIDRFSGERGGLEIRMARNESRHVAFVTSTKLCHKDYPFALSAIQPTSMQSQSSLDSPLQMRCSREWWFSIPKQRTSAGERELE